MFYTVTVNIQTSDDMKQLGARLADRLTGGERIELIGDIGAGKTTFVQGLGAGLGADDTVQSPSFTISREYYCRDSIRLVHYDFYRLSDAGVMSYELDESLNDPMCITVVEWASTINAILPDDTIRIAIQSTPADESRVVTIEGIDL